jgi:hypothetical protein
MISGLAGGAKTSTSAALPSPSIVAERVLRFSVALRPTAASATPSQEEVGSLVAGADAQDLVGRAQVFLHGGFGQEEPLCYFGVGKPFDQELYGLLLTSGKYAQIRGGAVRPSTSVRAPWATRLLP